MSADSPAHTIVVDCCGRPLLSNHRLHHMEKARQVKAWREAGCVLARAARIPKLSSVDVECWGRYPTRRTPDVDAVAPCLKAVLDGIVDANVLVDDKPPFVRSITYRMPQVVRDAPAALVVTLTEAA